MPLKLIVQLDDSTFSRGNCGCVATAHAIAWSTKNKVKRTPHQCRMALDGQWVGPGNATSLRDQSRAWKSLRRATRRKGLRLPPFDIRLLTAWGEVITALDAGHAVMLQIDNDTLNRKARELSGFPGFHGLHVVLITEIRRVDGRIELLDYDGGYDGRVDNATGLRVPRGPQWVPARVLKEAAEEKNVITLKQEMSEAAARDKAAGTATFAVISRAEPVQQGGGGEHEEEEEEEGENQNGGGEEQEEQEEGPDPATVEELRARLKQVRSALADARAANELLEDQNITLENALGIIRTLLAVAKAQGAVQALAAANAEIDQALPPPATVDIELEDGVGAEL